MSVAVTKSSETTNQVVKLHPDVIDTTEEEVQKAVERAREEFNVWSALSFKERARHLAKVRKLLAESADDIVDVIVSDTGKVPTEALVNEVVVTVELMRWYGANGEKALAPTKVNPGILMAHKSGEIRYEPYGVVGIISPWNYPLTLSMGPIVAALFAGNTVVVKPSEVTPHVGIAVGELFKKVANEVGAHHNLVQVITGPGKVGDTLVRSGVDKVAFTGSVKTGQAVMKAAAETLTPVVLELGGKDPMVVLADADIERAARGAVWGAFTNSGQTCMAVERVYVEKEIYQPFLDKVVEITSKLKQGSGDGFDLGAMTWKRQKDIVRAHLDDAISKGAVVAAGGNDLIVGGRESIEPTVLVNVNHSMAIMTEETFGPVLPIMEVANEKEALELANDSIYGLNSSVWGKDPQALERVASGLQAGNVCINDTMVSYALSALPFGGVKYSGIGRTHGVEGLRSMTQTKSIARDRFGLKSEMQWMPLPSWLGKGAKLLLKLRK
ncbi:MAG: aldehyde dehydrogenase family protein [Acidimicrobiales bacterium]|nr:aldehyde dehydrogenase family protein [Acidimicrobiales bacterium]